MTKISKKFRKAVKHQQVELDDANTERFAIDLKRKCCKSYKKKKGEMCKRCPKLLVVLDKKGYLTP